MFDTEIIDLSVLPFTHEMKAGPWTHTKELRESMLRVPGAWEMSFSPSQLIEMLNGSGITKILMPAQAGCVWEVPYEVVASIASEYPGRIYGMAGIDPRDIIGGLKKLENAVLTDGFVGAHSYPHWFGLSPDDRVYYPFYAKCVELGVPIQIQIGHVYQIGLRNIARPGAIDTIAVNFPDLKVIAIHTGYPWERELVAVSWKHPNVYVGADAFHPRQWAPELVSFIKGVGRHKVMFGTNYPAVRFAEALEGVEALGLDVETRECLLSSNVRSVYSL